VVVRISTSVASPSSSRSKTVTIHDDGKAPFGVGFEPLQRVAAPGKATKDVSTGLGERHDRLLEITRRSTGRDTERLRSEQSEAVGDTNLIIILDRRRFSVMLHHLRKHEIGKLPAMRKKDIVHIFYGCQVGA
jgi:hypothetical protein